MNSTLRRDHRFAKFLTREMKRGGWSRAELARELRVGRTTVYGWLNGAEPSDENFSRLARLFPRLSAFKRAER